MIRALPLRTPPDRFRRCRPGIIVLIVLPKSILVVDDDIPTGALLQALFVHSGYRCDTLRCPVEAGARLHEIDYDAVVIDHRLFAGLNGVRGRIAACTIVLTAAPRAFCGPGVYAILPKPADLQALLAHVQACTSMQ
jgi:DNA-binding response OmpR family regulator